MLTRYFLTGLFIAALAALVIGPITGGILASIVFGFMAGNFACSLVHRLPRGKSILENAPYCGACAHPLSEADLLPVIGALLLKHKCRYCGTPFPHSHTGTEILIGLLFTACYMRLGFSQDYILVALLGTFLVTLAAIEINDKRIMMPVLLTAMVTGMIYRTAHDGEIYNFLQGGLYGLFIGAAVWHKQIKRVAHTYTLPENAKLTAMAGLCMGAISVWPTLALATVFYGVLWLIGRILKWERVPVSVPVGLAIIVVMLFPVIPA